MGYIEREAVKEKLSPMLNDPEAIDFWEWQCSEIDDIPDADVRPVVRGFWVVETGEDAHTGAFWCIWKCSECGARRTAGWRYTQDGRKPRDNFCPNCGAMMEES